MGKKIEYISLYSYILNNPKAGKIVIRYNTKILHIKCNISCRYYIRSNMHLIKQQIFSILTLNASPYGLSSSSLSRIGATLPNICKRNGLRCRIYNCLQTYSIVRVISSFVCSEKRKIVHSNACIEGDTVKQQRYLFRKMNSNISSC